MQGHVADVSEVRSKLHYYIKNFSLWIDSLIVFRTMITMLTGSERNRAPGAISNRTNLRVI